MCRIAWFLAALLLAGCTQNTASTQRQLSGRERDSLIGVSALPGAPAVTRALATQDSMASRSGKMNEQLNQTGETTPDPTR